MGLKQVLEQRTRKLILIDGSGSIAPIWRATWKVIYHIMARLRQPLGITIFYAWYYIDKQYLIGELDNARIYDAGRILFEKFKQREGLFRLREEPPEPPLIFTGGTPLFNAIQFVVEQFPERQIIVITDGYENMSSRTELPQTDKVFIIFVYHPEGDEYERKMKEKLKATYPHIEVTNEKDLERILF